MIFGIHKYIHILLQPKQLATNQESICSTMKDAGIEIKVMAPYLRIKDSCKGCDFPLVELCVQV